MSSTPAQRLARALNALLMDDGQVCLPTLGTFQLDRQPAVVNKLEHTAVPPSQTVQFNANLRLDDGRLQRYYDEHFPAGDMETVSGDDYISLPADLATVTTALDLRQSVTLPEIGRLFRHYDGRLSFTPSGTNFSADSYGLPVLTDIHPISRKERRGAAKPVVDPLAEPSRPRLASVLKNAATPAAEGTAAAAATADLPFYKRPAVRQYGLYALYAGLILLIGWLTFAILRNIPGFLGNDSARVDRTEIPSDRFNVPPPTRRPAPDVDASLVRPEEPPRLNDRPTLETRPENDAPRLPETNASDQETPAPTPAPDPPPRTSAPAPTPPAAANGENVAVIAIGLYGRARNVTKMENRLSDAGYEAYADREGALTRVGAYIRYRDPAELDAALADLKQRYTEDAFVLEINGRTLPREERR